jgi:hypothetical protein
MILLKILLLIQILEEVFSYTTSIKRKSYLFTRQVAYVLILPSITHVLVSPVYGIITG